VNPIFEKLTGMAPLTDQVIATDILMAAKSEIKNYALAITETATPEIRNTLVEHLEDVIKFHENLSEYMIDKGFYHPHDMSTQIETDMKISKTAMKLAGQE